MTSEKLNLDEVGTEPWMHALRRDPAPAFTARLRERLRAEEPPLETRRAWPRRVMAAAAAVLVTMALVSVPAVRASVARFVSLFRVINVVAVPVDSSRLGRLNADDLKIDTLIGEHIQIVQDPGAPMSVASLDEAAAAAGMPLATPQWLPDNTHIIETAVMGERAMRVTGSSQRLAQVLDALGINDVPVPSGLDGQTVDVRVPPVVMIRYDHPNNRRSRLFQARPPELTMPNDLDLQALGEIGLRILGLPSAEARQFAQLIDWRTTLVVPVPPNASSFQQIDVNGHPGVLIQHQPRDQSPTTTIVWSTPERVFALVSIQHVAEVTAMATSVR
jgi:hypothetical protein